jgi:hypothetical protein
MATKKQKARAAASDKPAQPTKKRTKVKKTSRGK